MRRCRPRMKVGMTRAFTVERGDENRTRMASLEVIRAPACTVKQTRPGSPWVTAAGRLSPPAVAQLWPAERRCSISDQTPALDSQPLTCKVAERVSLSVVYAWPATNSRIHHRQAALLLLHFAAASLLARTCCRGLPGSAPLAKSANRGPRRFAGPLSRRARHTPQTRTNADD
jgi:hypothetical protein